MLMEEYDGYVIVSVESKVLFRVHIYETATPKVVVVLGMKSYKLLDVIRKERLIQIICMDMMRS